MTPTEKLVERLRVMGYAIPPDAVVLRTYAGHWQRSQGAWSWSLEYDPYAIQGVFGQRPTLPRESPWKKTWGVLSLGSQFSVSKLLQCKHEWQIDAYIGSSLPDRSIDPCQNCWRRLVA